MHIRVGRTDFLKRIAVILLIVGGLSCVAVCQDVAEFSSYHDGKRYDFRLTQERLAQTPIWHDDEPNPPLSVRQAKVVGTEYVKQLFADGDKWEMADVTLRPVADRWIYEIAFTEPPPPGCNDYLSSDFRVVVTMDGIAVPANVSPWKPALPPQMAPPSN